MKTIWKFDLHHTGQRQLPMPAGAKILTVQMQGDKPTLWAEVDTDQPTLAREIVIYSTGDTMPVNPGKYLGTFQNERMPGWGVFVGHVYDRTGLGN